MQIVFLEWVLFSTMFLKLQNQYENIMGLCIASTMNMHFHLGQPYQQNLDIYIKWNIWWFLVKYLGENFGSFWKQMWWFWWNILGFFGDKFSVFGWNLPVKLIFGCWYISQCDLCAKINF
jgi:hypothetical protein